MGAKKKIDALEQEVGKITQDMFEFAEYLPW